MAVPKLYLAGPDVFLPHAAAMAQAKRDLCAAHGLEGIAPFNPNLDLNRPAAELWRAIYADDLRMMRESDAILANLTPFRGASADAGTLLELGWFLGRGKPIFGYSNCAALFCDRSQAQQRALPGQMSAVAVEDFGLPDNLMVPGAVEWGGGLAMTLPPDGLTRPFDALDIFEICVAQAAKRLVLR